MVAQNIVWGKDTSPSATQYAIEGCAEAGTDFDQLGDVPVVYEVVDACPSYQDAVALYGKVNWTKLVVAGWQPTPMPTFGTASKSFTQFYAYDSSGDGGCYAYMTIFETHDVLGVAGYWDQISDAGSRQAVSTAAQGWTRKSFLASTASSLGRRRRYCCRNGTRTFPWYLGRE